MEQKRIDAATYGISAGTNRWIVRVSPTRYTDDRGTKWIRKEEIIGGGRRRAAAWKVGPVPGFTRDCLSSEAVEAIEAACGGAGAYDFIKEGKKKAATATASAATLLLRERRDRR